MMNCLITTTIENLKHILITTTHLCQNRCLLSKIPLLLIVLCTLTFVSAALNKTMLLVSFLPINEFMKYHILKEKQASYEPVNNCFILWFVLAVNGPCMTLSPHLFSQNHCTLLPSWKRIYFSKSNTERHNFKDKRNVQWVIEWFWQ